MDFFRVYLRHLHRRMWAAHSDDTMYFSSFSVLSSGKKVLFFFLCVNFIKALSKKACLVTEKFTILCKFYWFLYVTMRILNDSGVHLRKCIRVNSLKFCYKARNFLVINWARWWDNFFNSKALQIPTGEELVKKSFMNESAILALLHSFHLWNVSLRVNHFFFGELFSFLFFYILPSSRLLSEIW